MVSIEVKNTVSNGKCFLSSEELKEVYKLIKDSGDVKKICGKEDWSFNEDILTKWCTTKITDKDEVKKGRQKKEKKSSQKVYAVAIIKFKKNKTDTKNQIIGFATLTNEESDIFNPRDIEICHLLVHPDYRHKNYYNGSKLVTALVEEAIKLNFDKVYGRVFNSNEIGKAFVNHLNWTPVIIKDDDCQWYLYKNDLEKFSTIVLDRMNYLDNITIEELSHLLGMSKQYINSLKNPLIGHPTKLPSPNLLHNLCLILGQKNASIFKQFLIEKASGIDWKDFKQYLFNKVKDKNLNRLYDNLDYEVVNKLLLNFAQLQRLEKGYIFTDNEIFNERELIDKEFRGKDRTEFNKSFEIWTLSDILAEQLSMQFSKDTIRNILDYDIKYRFFVPINDLSNWRLSIQNIEKAYKEAILDLNYKEKWSVKPTKNKKHFSDYVHIYGIPENMLFVKMRIYDPKGINSFGNLNLGGITEEEFRFVEIPQEIKDKIIFVIEKILVNEQLSSGSKIYVEDYSLNVIKKYPIIN